MDLLSVFRIIFQENCQLFGYKYGGGIVFVVAIVCFLFFADDVFVYHCHHHSCCVYFFTGLHLVYFTYQFFLAGLLQMIESVL